MRDTILWKDFSVSWQVLSVFTVKVHVVSCDWFYLSLEIDYYLFMFRVPLLSVDFMWNCRHSVWSKRDVGGFQYQSLHFLLFWFSNCTHLLIHIDFSIPQITEVLGLSLILIILKEECWMWKKIICLRSLCQISLDGVVSIAAVPYVSIFLH